MSDKKSGGPTIECSKHGVNCKCFAKPKKPRRARSKQQRARKRQVRHGIRYRAAAHLNAASTNASTLDDKIVELPPMSGAEQFGALGAPGLGLSSQLPAQLMLFADFPDGPQGTPFEDLVREFVTSSPVLSEKIIAAVHDADVPVREVDEDLAGADVNVTVCDEESGTASVQLVVRWSALLAIDYDGDMTETGSVCVTAELSHRKDRSFEIANMAFEVSYDHLFTADEDEASDGKDVGLPPDGVF